MAGCSGLPKPCKAPEDDSPTKEECANSEVVRQFIKRVWNYRWTSKDDKAFLDAREKGNQCYVPPSIAAALDELRSSRTIRHRRDRKGKPIRSTGADDYATCVNAVHEVIQEIKLKILDLVVDGDRVVAHIAFEGVDRRADKRTDRPGAFGAKSPTGARFRVHTATFYRVRNGRIAEDWLAFEVPYPGPLKAKAA
jgi:predicted ester cyclase